MSLALMHRLNRRQYGMTKTTILMFYRASTNAQMNIALNMNTKMRNFSSSSSASNKNNNEKKPEQQQGRKKILTRHDVECEAAARRAHEQAVHNAKWVSSWMTPWERAQMDAPVRPLKLWERVYWQLFVVLGSVGFAYETWVLGNRRILIGTNSTSSNNHNNNYSKKYQSFNKPIHENDLFCSSMSSSNRSEIVYHHPQDNQ